MKEPLNTPAFLKTISKTIGLIAIATGLAIAAGWLMDVPFLRSFLPQTPLGVSCSFILTGIALYVLSDKPEATGNRTARVLSAVVMAIGILSILRDLSGADSVIYRLLLIKEAAHSMRIPSGIMPAHSLFSFILIGMALLSIDINPRIYFASQWFALLSFFISLLHLAGYGYGIGLFNSGTTFYSAILLLMSTGVLFARPGTGLMRISLSRSMGGFLLRRLLPVAVFLPLILGWVRLKGEHAGLYSTEVGLLIFAASNVIILVAVIWRYTGFLDKTDMERLHAEEQLRKVNRALKILSRCNMELVRARSEKELLDSICRVIVDAGYRMAWVGYAGGGVDKKVEPKAHAGLEAGYLERAEITWADTERGMGPTGTAIRTGTPVTCKNILHDSRFAPWRDEAARLGYVSSIAVPLIAGEKTFGALSIYAAEPDAFDQEEVGLIAELAQDLSYGITALRTRAENMRVDEESRLIKTIALSTAEAQDMRAAICIALNKVCEFIGWTFGEAWIPRHDGSVLECARVWTHGIEHDSFISWSEGMTFHPGEGLPGRVWKSAQPEWIKDVANGGAYLRAKAASGINLRSALGAPIVSGGHVLAVLAFYKKEPGKEDEHEVRLITAVAAQLGPIAQHKLMGEALRESEHKYKQLLENLPQRIFLKDRDSVYISCNGNYAADLNTSPEEIAGKTDYDFHPAHLADKYRADDRYVIESGVTKDMDEGYIKDGREFFVHTVKTPVMDEKGAVSGVLGIFWDVTDIKRAAEEKKELEEQLRQMQKMEAIGQLTSGIAHDFNNMLAAITLSGSLVEQRLTDAKLKNLVQQILAAAEKATTLTKGLLAFSRKQVIEVKPVSLNGIIRNIEKLLIRLIGEEIEFKVDLPEKEIGVLADAGQIEQVLINLSTNARDAMPKGGTLSISANTVKLDDAFIKTHGLGAPGPYAKISVSDTGMGMDKATAQRVFEPFFTTKEVGKGTGLGLSIVYGIIKQHNGLIEVSSGPGTGTVFNIYLPVIEMRVFELKALKTVPPPAGTETVLLAEDNDEVRNITRTFLSLSGYKVIEATDGEEALDRFIDNSGPVSLLILDVIMPKKNGREVYAEALKHKPGVKAIFTSGYNYDVIRGKGAFDHGLTFVSKPYVPSDFLRKVREVLDGGQ